MTDIEIKSNRFGNLADGVCVPNKPARQEFKRPPTTNSNPCNNSDRFTPVDSGINGENSKETVSFGQAVKSFLNGLISPLTMFKNPSAWLLLAAGGLLAALVPVTVPILFAVGLIMSSGYLAKGITNAIIAGVNGDGKGFANAFENIGTGTIGILLARISFGRAAKCATLAKDRAIYPHFLPSPKSNFYEICSLFTTKNGWKAIGSSFTYKKGISQSLGTIKSNLEWLIFHRPGTPLSAYYGWGHWFQSLMGFFGNFLPVWNQPFGFGKCSQVF